MKGVADTRSGFTLVETIVASVILCGSVLALAAISTRCLGGTRLNRQYEVAAALAEKQLSMVDFTGVEEFIQTGQSEGESDEFDVAYRWQVDVQSEGVDYLYLVTVTVTWAERGTIHSLSVDTRLNGTGMLALMEAGESR